MDWTPPFCTITDSDFSNCTYLSCSLCSKTLNPNSAHCSTCSFKTLNPKSPTLLFRLLLSVATTDRISTVVCFDRAARVLIGCSAQEFLGFCDANPNAGEKARELLQGEMCKMGFKRARNGNAEHLRVVSVEPLRMGFKTVIESLREIYCEVGF